MSLEVRLVRWFLRGKAGVSSRAIVAHLTGIDTVGQPGDHPHDTGDFGRCYELLESIPEYRSRIGELAERSNEWAALVEHWDELSELYASGQDVRCYARMRWILDAVPGQEGVQLRDGVTFYGDARQRQ